ncbi:MAG: hypothetical protein HC875_33420 [Anaerolineales bacterium]|nr:hypothetical protein [Anaerolineales bacterium]
MSIQVKISEKEKNIIKLIARRTIDGQIIVDDHPDISIVINLRDKK